MVPATTRIGADDGPGGDLFDVAQKQFAADHHPERQRRGQRRDHDHGAEAQGVEHEQQAEGFERAAER